VVNFDGAGNASLTSAVSLNGNIIPRRTSLSGTYVVNPDCTGEVAFVLPVPGGTTVSESHMVIVEHGKEFFLVNTGTGRVLVTTGKKQ
jgi:uncharacterized protein (AIM24 family)